MPTVLIGEFNHETNTFSRVATDVEHFRQRLCLEGAAIEAMKDTNCEIAGFYDGAARHGLALVPTIAASAGPGGTVTEAAYAAFGRRIVEGARATKGLHAILLALHGAMVTQGDDDGEGRLLEDLRATVGPALPIVVTLDLHANVTDRMARLANALISYRTYPHTDMRERGQEAAALTARAIQGEVRPVTAVARRAMVEGADHGRTGTNGPMVALLKRARAMERDEKGVLSVSINGGFGDADMRDAGPSVVVVGDGPSPRWRALAEDLMDEVWRRRDEFSVAYLAPAEAVRQAKAAAGAGGPVVIADYADNPGGGAYGDATNLLAALIEGRCENAVFGCLRDPGAVEAMHRAGAGAALTLDLGGKTEPTLGGGPLKLSGRVVSVSDGTFRYEGPMYTGGQGRMGPSAVFRVGGTEIVLTTYNLQVLDQQMYKSQGIDPREKSVVAVKSMHHFRGAFAPIAKLILTVDCGGLTSPDYRKRPYRKLRRPIYPLDPAEACEAAR
jgi:microcystin degradation protein MlrC